MYNHLRKWRARWVQICKLKDLSGSNWDEHNFMITLSDEHYAGHVKVSFGCTVHMLLSYYYLLCMSTNSLFLYRIIPRMQSSLTPIWSTTCQCKSSLVVVWQLGGLPWAQVNHLESHWSMIQLIWTRKHQHLPMVPKCLCQLTQRRINFLERGRGG